MKNDTLKCEACGKTFIGTYRSQSLSSHLRLRHPNHNNNTQSEVQSVVKSESEPTDYLGSMLRSVKARLDLLDAQLGNLEKLRIEAQTLRSLHTNLQAAIESLQQKQTDQG